MEYERTRGKVKFDERARLEYTVGTRHNFGVSGIVSQMVSYRGQLGRFSRRKSKGDVNQRITSIRYTNVYAFQLTSDDDFEMVVVYERS